MPLLVIAAVFSAAFVCAVYLVAKSRSGVGGVCVMSALAMFAFVFVLSPALALQALLTLVLGLVCLALRAKPRTITACAAAAAVASTGFFLCTSWGQLRKWQSFRAEYPIESLADRLAYERAGSGANQAGSNGVQRTERARAESHIELAPDVEARLDEMETLERNGLRAYSLMLLHERTRDGFVLAQGFGPVRMMGVRRERIELPETPRIELPQPSEHFRSPGDNRSLGPLAEGHGGAAAAPSRDELLSLHDSGLGSFLDPERMGYVQDQQHVAGFLPHAFSAPPHAGPDPDFGPTNTEWQVTRLELVSLLKHATPVAYVSENLPRMDELRDAPTRALDEFERQAIDKLRRDEDLIVSEQLNRIRMVGALRAGKNCLDCHSVKRGELLGAFSYELLRIRPLPDSREAPQT